MADNTQNFNTQVDCFDWDDTIENDGQDFVILPEGDYVFQVTNFERGRFPGSAKIPPCNKAALTLQVKTDNGLANIKTDLILHKSLEWKLSSFFRAIGQKKHGEKLTMNWNTVVGSYGRAHIKQREYIGNDGNKRTANDVDKYYDYDVSKMPGMNADGMMQLPDDTEVPF